MVSSRVLTMNYEPVAMNHSSEKKVEQRYAVQVSDPPAKVLYGGQAQRCPIAVQPPATKKVSHANMDKNAQHFSLRLRDFVASCFHSEAEKGFSLFAREKNIFYREFSPLQ